MNEFTFIEANLLCSLVSCMGRQQHRQHAVMLPAHVDTDIPGRPPAPWGWFRDRTASISPSEQEPPNSSLWVPP